MSTLFFLIFHKEILEQSDCISFNTIQEFLTLNQLLENLVFVFALTKSNSSVSTGSRWMIRFKNPGVAVYFI